MAGMPITGEDINLSIGSIAFEITRHLRRAANLKRFTDKYDSQELAKIYNISLDDANLIKSALGELYTINSAFQTRRVFIDQVAGLGDV